VGRASLKNERITQILDAYEYCLETRGFQGATLDNVAEKAGLARRMIGHFIGNREALMKMAVTRIVKNFNNEAFSFVDNLESTERIKTGLIFLFSDNFNQLPSTKMVASLLGMSLHEKLVLDAVKSIYNSFFLALNAELTSHIPNAPTAQRKQVAFTIMSLSFGGSWMGNIGFDLSLNRQNLKIAQGLISELEDKYL
jgi:AcrR family transcriptional regulator